MSPELWRNISNVFLIAGIIFLVLTVWLSSKFHLISIIQTEINNRKDRKNSDEIDYFTMNENKVFNESEESISHITITDNNKNFNNASSTVLAPQQEELNTSNTVLAPQQEELNTSNTVLAPQQEELNTSNTVLAPQQEELNTSNTVFVPQQEEINTIDEEDNNETDDFIISENIIVIHGDPSSIRRKVVL
ncbi:MAG: hypothetical protein NC177_02590 [Ruminococcus flavefaciens]|nr:hypothetical protein [Ruminococcus flavefaciens]